MAADKQKLEKLIKRGRASMQLVIRLSLVTRVGRLCLPLDTKIDFCGILW
jgi:hypothetical protein